MSAAGIKCDAVQDGLVISPSEQGIERCFSDSHDDHRLAMSMAVLGTVRPDIVIGEWRCVEKTFSDYWDMLRKLGVGVTGQPLPSLTKSNVTATFLIGMRNSGKTSLGSAAARVLGLKSTRKIPTVLSDRKIGVWQFRSAIAKRSHLARKKLSNGFQLAHKTYPIRMQNVAILKCTNVRRYS